MQSWFGGGSQPVANSSGQLVPATNSGLETLPAHEILRKLELERKEAARAREELFQKEEELRALKAELINSKRLHEAEIKSANDRIQAFESRLLLAEQVQTSTKQQLDDKTHQLEAANLRTTALLSQQNQLQSSFKTFQYQTDQDTMTTIREREALMSKRVVDLENQLEQQRLSFQNQLALPQDAQVKAEEIHLQNARRVEMAERAMADAMEKEAKMKGERDLWMARAKEAEATLEAKREALADRMKAESDSVKAAREAAAARVQREAAGARAVRMEMAR